MGWGHKKASTVQVKLNALLALFLWDVSRARQDGPSQQPVGDEELSHRVPIKAFL